MMTMSLWAYTRLYSKSVSYTPPSPLWLSVMGNGNYPKMITPSGSPMQLLQHFVSICGHISVLLLTHSKMSVPHLQAGHILQASLPAMGIHLDPLAIPTLWYSCFMTNHIVHQRQSKGIVWRGPMQRRTNYLWLKSLPKFLKITKEPGAIFESSFCQDCLYHSGGVLKGACSSKDVRVGFALWRNAEPMLSGKPVSWAVYSNDAVAAALSHMQMWDWNTSLGYVISKKTSVRKQKIFKRVKMC